MAVLKFSDVTGMWSSLFHCPELSVKRLYRAIGAWNREAAECSLFEQLCGFCC